MSRIHQLSRDSRRSELLARLAVQRAQIEQALVPPARAQSGGARGYPRSLLMTVLLARPEWTRQILNIALEALLTRVTSRVPMAAVVVREVFSRWWSRRRG